MLTNSQLLEQKQLIYDCIKPKLDKYVGREINSILKAKLKEEVFLAIKEYMDIYYANSLTRRFLEDFTIVNEFDEAGYFNISYKNKNGIY